MDPEDEDASKLLNLPTRFEDDSVADPHEEVQRETEPQCHSDSVAELSKARETAPERVSMGKGKEEADDSGEANEGEMSGGHLDVLEPVVGGGGNHEDLICEHGKKDEETEVKGDDAVEEREGRADVAEETGIKAEVAEETRHDAYVAEETRHDADVAEETRHDADVAEETRNDANVAEERRDDADVAEVTGTKVDLVEETEIKVDGIEETEVKADVVGETEMKAEVAEEMVTKADTTELTEIKVNMDKETEIKTDMTEEKEIKADIAGDTETNADMAEEREMDPDVAGEKEIKTYIAEETEIKEEVADPMEDRVTMVMEDRTAMLTEMEIVEDELTSGTEEVTRMAEDIAIQDGKKDADLVQETDEQGGVLAKLEVEADLKPEEMDTAGIAKETAAVEETSAAKAAGDVADKMGMLEEDIVMANVAGGAEVAEDTEMREVAKMEEVDTEMGDMAEEAGADITNEMERADVTEETETGEEGEEVGKTVGGKRKRGKNPKLPGRPPSKKKSEEDVCFICFDGGELVLCDRRGCPKAYHPSCVNRDEAFFRAKGRWNCGWHLCSICEKNAYYMCYTCTFSLCKGCIKDAVILCVRGNKGFCETCMRTVMLIETNQQGNKEMNQVDFDDKSSWEYLFKDYWLDLKGRLSLSSEEVTQAKNPWKGPDTHAGKRDSPDELYVATNDGGHGSDSSSENAEVTAPKKRKMRRRSKSRVKEGGSLGTRTANGAEGPSTDENVEWASKELLDLVMHMRNGDKSVLSQFDVQTLLLDYIKRYKLRDPHGRTHVICDSRLQNLFGKPRVGHFEMLKLLESHFLVREDSQVDDLQGSVVDTEANQMETDGNSDVLVKGSKDKKRKTRKKGDERGLQSNVDDYAAIDMHNINLIYLRRNLVEELLEDTETFHDKVVGSFVRIRISGSALKQDLYRLVQVVGTSKVAEPYRVGKRMTDILLEILNLSKTEVVSMDIISNQEFTEDECKRLRQSIKCGLINCLTVGDIQEKAMALQSVRVKDSMEAEILRLSHLRDRASDLGRRKELRECVEKLQLLKTPEERQRRLEDIPEIHSDPKMDPSYESDEDVGETDDKRQENYVRSRGSGFSRRGREPISPGRGASASNDSFSGTRNYSGGKELNRNLSNKGFSNKGDDFVGAGEIVNENLWNQARAKETLQLNSWEKPRIASNLETKNPHPIVLSEPNSRVVSEISPVPGSTGVAQSSPKINESEKMWHYKDPSGKVQGPFSMVQLRKWNNTGYFPTNLRIWRSTEKQEDSILLTDALSGNFSKDPPLADISLSQTVSYSGKAHGATLQQGMEIQVGGNSNFDQNRTAWNSHDSLSSGAQSVLSSSAGGAAPSSLEVPNSHRDGWASETNLPSPTPSTTVQSKGKAFEREWSPTPTKPSAPLMMTNQFPGGNGGQQSSAVLVPESGQLMHSSTPTSSTSKLSGNMDSLNMSHGVSSASKPEVGESPRVLVNSHQLPVTNSVVASMNAGVDLKNIGAALQSLVQPVTAQIPPTETHGFGSGLVAQPEMMAPSPKPGSGSQAWGNTSSQKLEPNNPVHMPAQSPAFAQPHASSFSMGNPSGSFPAPGQSGMPPSNSWRPLVPGQSNIQPPPAQPNIPWGMGVSGHQSAVPRQGPENQNTGWGQMPVNPSMGWGGQLPASTNMSWGAQGQAQAPPNANSGWSAPVNGQVPGNSVPTWVPPGQGPPPINANPVWVPPGQGPAPGNANPGWGAPTGNSVIWGGEQKNGGDRFSGQRDRNPQGGDSGYSGGRQWNNRQSSFGNRVGGDSSRPPFNKGQRVCKFHESGHCKKGSQCDYLHT
ncbi:zinc finger CCCH domain-containing protein 19-like isoform X2 [Mangifera indica]|uniref:zinc finger CCCH domain-containing protein 19-like isoform X2 n=1 Tax=Mangifera indica TaxID=29780 RepID=UPI001CFA7CCE|nr:zinc finger CCCH domain-containing protein 19-like isoform X2 [Mangifera indica]